jgi:hypothetical protein
MGPVAVARAPARRAAAALGKRPAPHRAGQAIPNAAPPPHIAPILRRPLAYASNVRRRDKRGDAGASALARHVSAVASAAPGRAGRAGRSGRMTVRKPGDL